MACRKRRNYGSKVAEMLLNWKVILVLAIAIPVFLFGIGSVLSLMVWMFRGPSVGDIPVWALLVAGLVIVMFLRGRRRPIPQY
jgi:hypothetical protein